ncbi:hypothetical protein [Flavobacterium cellulosilyticum]|uniref:Uncharacterized protein n=1 Tax=Flavobacterium cellulosilyticum TaxID=2541731 RepID=A0A4R5CKH6_9FLAO|nr:hypothetical protein [Flavobacterium cellulosilyticum]TDD97952.1 hypothetical protein E0F76_07600 [Flavobacterium cellulosilyticum]
MKSLNYIISPLLLSTIIISCSYISDPMITASNDTYHLNSLKKIKTPAIWADCNVYATIGTNTSFKPTAGNFDELYNGANFKDGIGAISESKPGDRDFNGGRWHVNSLKPDVDPDKYRNACAVEDLDLNDFMSTSTYFECPLRPINGMSGN